MASGDRFLYTTSGAYKQLDDIVPDGPGGVLNQAGGFNPTANAGFIMFFHTKAADLAPGAIPDICFQVPAGGSFSYADVLQGLKFVFAMSFAVSTTGDVYTPSADEWWVMAQGRLG